MSPALTAQRSAAGWLLFLPLPPSENRRLILHRHTRRKILSREARAYLEEVGQRLWAWGKSAGYKPIADRDRGGRVNLWGVLPRTSADPSNYEKCLFDAMQRGCIVTNDRLILHTWRGLWYDTKAPQLIVEVPC